jgi:AraC-like DNA-binding protein
VSSIAHACGYADHSAFTRRFVQAVGTTPSKYRRQSNL